MVESFRLRITKWGRKNGFVRLPPSIAARFPDKPTPISVILDDQPKAHELRLDKRGRIWGLKGWFDDHDARPGDVVLIETGNLPYGLRYERAGRTLEPSMEPSRPGARAATLMERDLYEPVRKSMAQVLSKTKQYHLEITADGRMSNELRKSLDDAAFYFLKSEKTNPDLTGFVVEEESQLGFGFLSQPATNHVVIEVKPEGVSVADIYQAKRYGEILDAKYAFLISTEPLAEEIRRFVNRRPAVISYSHRGTTRRLIFGVFHLESNEIRVEPF